MTEGLLDFMGYDHQQLRLTTDLGEAVGRWVRHRYPTNTAKLLAREIGCEVKTAENIAAGHLSATTLTRMLKAYGWGFLAAIGAAALGETYEQAINREIEEIDHERRHLEAREAGLRARYGALRARSAVDPGGLRLVHPEDGGAARELGGERRGVGPR